MMVILSSASLELKLEFEVRVRIAVKVGVWRGEMCDKGFALRV